MKYDLSALPVMDRARIKATKVLLAACRAQLRGPDSALNTAYAEHAHRFQVDLDALESVAAKTAPLRRDRREASAAVAAHAGGNAR